jgi:hypothetical protein
MKADIPVDKLFPQQTDKDCAAMLSTALIRIRSGTATVAKELTTPATSAAIGSGCAITWYIEE